MLDRAKVLSKVFGYIPSSVYAILYLLAIPTFAFIYTNMPNGFYHSTVQHESILDADANKLLANLRNAIINEFKQENGSTTKDIGLWKFNIEKISLYSLKPDKTKLTFGLRAELDGINEMKGAMQSAPAQITFDAHIRYAVGFPGDPERTIYAEPQIYPETFPVPAIVLFPAKIATGPAVNPTPMFAIPDQLHNQILGFLAAVRGFPAAASGSFARMFYFSAVTITTLGYGDIVPITNAARIAVAIESILGIVLGGLFINSLFQERNTLANKRINADGKNVGGANAI
jgi:hypothetical protein